MERRSFLTKSLAGSMIAPNLFFRDVDFMNKSDLKGNINQSVCYWPFAIFGIEFEEFLQHLKSIGIYSVDLVKPESWDLLKKYDMNCSMVWGAELGIEKGWNDPQYHDTLVERYSEIIPKMAEYGFTNLICFSGNRGEISDMTGLANCVSGFKRILPLAEKHNVVLQIELLNSKVDHKDYMCDDPHWGIELCKILDSENFKLLYDIYHMQIMKGDIIRTIEDHHIYFGHYHTGGNPGRNEIDDSQELNYPAIMKAIKDTGYKGYVGQEFIPSWDDKLAALTQGVEICDI